MIKTFVLPISVAAALIAAPASAAVYLLGTPGAATKPASVTVTPATTSNALTLTARSYTVAPTALTATTQFTGTTVLARTPVGIGACVEGGSVSGECAQVDTNGSVNEAITATFATPTRLKSVRLSVVDGDDTLRLYGVSGTALTLIGFGGAIATGLDAFAGSSFVGALNGGTYVVRFAPSTPEFASFVFTSRNNSADGYVIDSITTVPEPASWALMVAGFGLAGASLRRRQRVVAA